jgi:hypothetical protein
MRELSSAIDTELQALKCDAFSYFEHEANPRTGNDCLSTGRRHDSHPGVSGKVGAVQPHCNG